MKILERREHPGLATLYLASLGSEDRLVEFVDTLEPGIPKSQKWVLMVSTQVGCPVGCRMCDAGALGYHGNLSSDEILGQIRYVVNQNMGMDLRSHPKVKIHFARMGEPSLNPHVLEALRLLAKEYPYSGVLPSLSTVAPKTPVVESFFENLMDIKNALFPGGRFQLQFSIHSLDEDKRQGIVPVKKWSLEEVADYGGRFVEPGDRKVTLNFALAQDEEINPKKLKSIFHPDRFLVKITPINPTQAAGRNGVAHLWRRAPDRIETCVKKLRQEGFDVVLSPSLPEEIAAATSCGQIWSGALRKRAEVAIQNQMREMETYVTAENIASRAAVWVSELKSRHRRFSFHPEESALMVVDMQDFFLNPTSPAYRPTARAILPNVRRLVEAFRKMERPVFFILHAHEDPSRDGGLMAQWWRNVCLAGTPEARVSPILGPRPEEAFRKCRYSAFTNPRLERALREKGVEEIVVAGIVTNLCVESTVRDAFDLGFRTFVPADGTAAHTEELHLAALKNLAFGFSAVRLTDDILQGVTVPS